MPKALCFPVSLFLLTYFKIFHDTAPTCLNSPIYECGPTLFYLFITSRFDKISFYYLLHSQEVRLAYDVCLVFEISEAWDLHVIIGYSKLYFYRLSVSGLLLQHSYPALWEKKKKKRGGKKLYITFKQN